jgi:hypothetical protein
MSDKQGENERNPSIFWPQGGTHCLQLAIPKKKVLESWGNLWIFSKSSFGGLSRQCLFFCGRLANFRTKKKKDW